MSDQHDIYAHLLYLVKHLTLSEIKGKRQSFRVTSLQYSLKASIDKPDRIPGWQQANTTKCVQKLNQYFS